MHRGPLRRTPAEEDGPVKVAFDIDGTIDSAPADFQSLMEALRAAGNHVVVLTWCSAKKPTKKDRAEKAEYLEHLGCGHCYDKLVVFGDPPHKAKAKWCKKHKVDILVDNSVKNAQLASDYCTVLLPWNTKAD
jgi:putative intracellular protease/amidase